MRHVGIAMGLASLVAAGSAQAGEWRLISVGRAGAVAVDISGIVAEGSKRTAWQAVMMPVASEGFDYVLIRQEWDCANQTSTMLSTVLYTEIGGMVGRDDSRRETTPVVPDSNEVHALDAICFGRFQVPDAEGWDSVMTMLRDYRTTPPE